jgi:hypothetical protein
VGQSTPVEDSVCAHITALDRTLDSQVATTNCKSFEWSYKSNCFNECRLSSSPLSDVLSGNSGSQFTSYDRNCIIPMP